MAAALNGLLYRAEIRRLLERLGIRKPWLWAFFAQSLSVLDLEFERIIYDCADDFPAFFPHPAEKRFVARVDEALCRRADLVFVGSEPLLVKKGPLNPLTFVVNHAADIAHFEKATDSDTVVPSDLDRIPRPRLGFVGMVDTVRFDGPLIARLAENPQYQVVIVGGTMQGASRAVPPLANVHRLGMKPVEVLPSYLKGMDVCLMPYRVNEATRNIYPLKLHEYLATGKPVVSTRIPAVEGLRELVYVADSTEEFVSAAARALAESNPELAESRRSRARKHSWEAHVKAKADVIAEHLPSGPAPPA
jgi:glycosyltransferase involved in cell wall biosynthesis